MGNPISLYSVALFFHILGALGLFVALGLEWMSLLDLQRAATAEQAREWLKLFAPLRWLNPVAWIMILIPGFYMTATVWGGVAWVSIALVTVILIAVIGAALTGRQMAPIGRAVTAESGLISPTLRQQLAAPLLRTSLLIRTALALGVVFLMTVKPDTIGSLTTIVLAGILGLAFSLPARSRDREKVQSKQAGD